MDLSSIPQKIGETHINQTYNNSNSAIPNDKTHPIRLSIGPPVKNLAKESDLAIT